MIPGDPGPQQGRVPGKRRGGNMTTG